MKMPPVASAREDWTGEKSEKAAKSGESGGGLDPGLQPDADLREEKKKLACCELRFNGFSMLVSLLQPMLSARCGALDAHAICVVPPSV
ncbi:hypothetical protein [Massilia sp. Mn16-1_5]|uniref:hypothetical protein n=1 Tax=Massilia sp. Mn16-1_5 TaxID=2079199 RepID=UPI00109ECE4F|nr:hypothetical protein [Massilia sp. Mn16-1_5]THC42834.1 hypothetical protein C2862_14645 [Massilia sp. Mn16-1_5]